MKKKIGYIYLFITFFIWGSIYVVSKFALDVMAPFMLLLIRYVVSVAALTVLLKLRGTRIKVKKEDRKYILIVGALGYFVSIGCQVMGTNLLDASLASLINAMNPISISILAMIFLGEKIHKKDVARWSLHNIGSGKRKYQRGRGAGLCVLRAFMVRGIGSYPKDLRGI